ncbi:MAG: WYL domain-containing protein [Oscillospiraceae bacterium]|nr:WYL domain-containing protein [Oscillospiraceae bacterium]
MAKSERQKLKLLYLRDYLRHNTDEQHPATVQQLIDYLASKDIHAERKSIYNDIRTLNEYDTEVLYKRGNAGGYYVAQRDFELSELKLLVDAVLSSRFLSAKRSAELIKKIAALSGAHGAELLRREVVLAGRVKTTEEEGFANVDAIHEAIRKNSRIAFRYFNWGTDLKKKFRDGEYEASPYALIWDDENYYLIAHSERHGLTHYRVDKMENIRLTGERRIFTEEMRQFDIAAYSREVFGMFRGERKQIKLRFENGLAGVVVDRFGQNILLIPDGKNHFLLTVDVSVSPNFLGWVAGFGGRASIVFPQSVVDEYRALCRAALNATADTN